MSSPARSGRTITVWDLPLRVFHWTMAVLVIVCIITGLRGQLAPHMLAGQALLILLAFRLIWGFVGGRTARFAQFIKGPAAIRAYLRGDRGEPGHNPLGAGSVIAMLGILIFQVGSGLFSQDEDGLYEGPFAKLIGGSLSSKVSGWHALSVKIIYALIALHLAAIVYYRVKGDNLVRPMLTGIKEVPPGASWQDTAGGNPWLALGIVVAAGVAWRLVLRLYG